MKHRVSELEGALLDAAVAKAEGVKLVDRAVFRDGMREVYSSAGVFRDNYDPSTSWTLGGPIIERERITIDQTSPNGTIWARCQVYRDAEVPRLTEKPHYAHGAKPLIAAMRSYVASKLGDEVELP
jgi:hypothetical protein